MATIRGCGYNALNNMESAMSGAVYKITVSRPDKPELYYFGQSICSGERWRQHLRALRAGRHDNARMQRSFVKYGEAAFNFSVILVCQHTAEAMTLYEQSILDFYLATLGGRRVLNVMRQCVRTHLGVKRRPESIAKLSAALKGKRRTPEQVAALSARLKGSTRSQESRDAQSARMKGRPVHPNSRAALEQARGGDVRINALRVALAGKPKVHSIETKAKIAATLSGRKQSPELIAKRIGPLRGRKQAADAIAKRVASRLANAAQGEALADG